MTDGRPPRHRVQTDPERVGRDLAGLVLTVVELIRELMERQALRRIDDGGLRDEQIEEIGLTLMALNQRMDELCEHFGLTRKDLDLDLGPLGRLLGSDQRDG
ncbi:gas vesicle protein K [Streptacidiphilus neutrinimicus]|uniref:gas vesicle protein K n=1 Tax=Streptacidiphilus neutrinimicus TaxID=105420 RepID=UPI0005AAACD7|nr:gas vesicle protein K [Streptacidiphilus neutrinimicus]